MSLFLTAFAVVLLSALATIGLVFLVRRYQVDNHPFIPGTDDVEGIYMVVLGALYAIFISFMIFVVWTQYYDAMLSVEQEANTLASVYRLSSELPQPMRDQIRQSCIDYAYTMIDNEWPATAEGRESPEGRAVVAKMWRQFGQLNPDMVRNEVVHDHLLDQFIQLTSLRRQRLLMSRIGLPVILYALLVFGAVLTIIFAVLFSVDNFLIHSIKAGVLAVTVSFMLFAIWALDSPFSGEVRVPPTAFQITLDMIKESP